MSRDSSPRPSRDDGRLRPLDGLMDFNQLAQRAREQAHAYNRRSESNVRMPPPVQSSEHALRTPADPVMRPLAASPLPRTPQQTTDLSEAITAKLLASADFQNLVQPASAHDIAREIARSTDLSTTLIAQLPTADQVARAIVTTPEFQIQSQQLAQSFRERSAILGEIEQLLKDCGIKRRVKPQNPAWRQINVQDFHRVGDRQVLVRGDKAALTSLLQVINAGGHVKSMVPSKADCAFMALQYSLALHIGGSVLARDLQALVSTSAWSSEVLQYAQSQYGTNTEECHQYVAEVDRTTNIRPATLVHLLYKIGRQNGQVLQLGLVGWHSEQAAYVARTFPPIAEQAASDPSNWKVVWLYSDEDAQGSERDFPSDIAGFSAVVTPQQMEHSKTKKYGLLAKKSFMMPTAAASARAMRRDSGGSTHSKHSMHSVKSMHTTRSAISTLTTHELPAVQQPRHGLRHMAKRYFSGDGRQTMG